MYIPLTNHDQRDTFSICSHPNCSHFQPELLMNGSAAVTGSLVSRVHSLVLVGAEGTRIYSAGPHLTSTHTSNTSTVSPMVWQSGLRFESPTMVSFHPYNILTTFNKIVT